MTQLPATNTALPPKNHNNPPSELEYLSENLTLRHIGVIRQAEAQIDLIGNFPAVFMADNEANFATDHIKRMKESQKVLENSRKDEKEPFLRQGKFVDSFFGDISKKLDNAIYRATAPLNDYLQRKAAAEKAERDAEAKRMREEQQEAARAVAAMDVAPLAEAIKVIDHANTMATVAASAEKLASVPVQTMAKASGAVGKSHMVEKWYGAVMNRAELDLEKLRPYFKDQALADALSAFIKMGGRECAGADIKSVTEVVVK